MRTRGGAVHERGDFFAEGVGLELQVAAEDHQGGIVAPYGIGDPGHRVEQHVGALELAVSWPK